MADLSFRRIEADMCWVILGVNQDEFQELVNQFNNTIGHMYTVLHLKSPINGLLMPKHLYIARMDMVKRLCLPVRKNSKNLPFFSKRKHDS